jgi:hypothetical protein
MPQTLLVIGTVLFIAILLEVTLIKNKLDLDE